MPDLATFFPAIRAVLSCLVLVDPKRVTEDIAMTLAEADPRARVILTSEAAVATIAMNTLTRLKVAFIGFRPL